MVLLEQDDMTAEQRHSFFWEETLVLLGWETCCCVEQKTETRSRLTLPACPILS